MGANLSSQEVVDTSADVIILGDSRSELYLLFFTAGSVYAMGMILGTVQLVDHWRGPVGDRSVGLPGVLAAILLSVGWPLILFYLWVLVT